VWGEPLDAANFRRSLALDSDAAYALPLGTTSELGPEGGRPPERYRATENWSAGSPVKRPAEHRHHAGNCREPDAATD
jgi:8-oxo-dGTP diphosphatase